VNKVMVKKVTTNLVSGSTIASYHKVTPREILEFTGVWILLIMEYTQLDSSLLKNFTNLKKEHKFDMSINRFKAIHSSLIDNVDDLLEIVNMLCASFQRLWSPGSVVAFDESVYAYQPKQKTKEKHEKFAD